MKSTQDSPSTIPSFDEAVEAAARAQIRYEGLNNGYLREESEIARRSILAAAPILLAAERERIAAAIGASIDNPVIRNGITEYTEGVRDGTISAALIARGGVA